MSYGLNTPTKEEVNETAAAARREANIHENILTIWLEIFRRCIQADYDPQVAIDCAIRGSTLYWQKYPLDEVSELT